MNEIKKYAKLTIVFFVLISVSCKKHAEEQDPYAYTVNTVTAASDSKLLLILNDDPLGNTNSSQLVKITASDQVLPISISDNNGNDVSDKFRPAQISNANPDFMMINFSTHGVGTATAGYLMKKTDGSLISVDDYGVPRALNGGLLNNRFTYYDGSSYIYAIAGDYSTSNTLIRISTVNPNHITITKVPSDTIKSIYSFDVDADNNIMAVSTSKSNKTKLRAFNNNAVSEIQDGYANQYWVGMNGEFNFRDNGYVKKTVYDANTNEFITSNDVTLYTQGINTNFYRDLSYKVSYGGKFVMVSDSRIFELDNPSRVPKEITTVPFANQKWIDHSQSKGVIFIAAENASAQQTIFRIDLANNYSYTTYPTAGKYNFYEIEAFEDGTVYATAKRNSDGKSVILKFAPDGTETLLDDTMNHKGIWLEKVSEF